jgi:hypothetical protein
VKNDKNDLASLRLAGTGWKNYYKDRVADNLSALNTPSAFKVKELFLRLVGVDVSSVLDPVSEPVYPLDACRT